VVVGRWPKPFVVPVGVLSHASGVLAEACLTALRSPIVPTINLDCNADSFNLYLNWLSRRVLCIENFGHHDTAELEHYAHWRTLLGLYRIGDYLKDNDFIDAIADAIISHAIRAPIRNEGTY